jgi:hypothetical protein
MSATQINADAKMETHAHTIANIKWFSEKFCIG